MLQHGLSMSFRSFAVFVRCNQRQQLLGPWRTWLERLCMRFDELARKANGKERVFWRYEDLGMFVLLVALLTFALHALVRIGVRIPVVAAKRVVGSGRRFSACRGSLRSPQAAPPKTRLEIARMGTAERPPSLSISAHWGITGHWSCAVFARRVAYGTSRSFD